MRRRTFLKLLAVASFATRPPKRRRLYPSPSLTPSATLYPRG